MRCVREWAHFQWYSGMTLPDFGLFILHVEQINTAITCVNLKNENPLQCGSAYTNNLNLTGDLFRYYNPGHYRQNCVTERVVNFVPENTCE